MAEEKMTDEEYETTQQQLLLFASLLRRLPLDGFVRRINTAESVGPILDPTLYRAASSKLEIVKKIAVAARTFQAQLPTEEECRKADADAEAAMRLSPHLSR